MCVIGDGWSAVLSVVCVEISHTVNKEQHGMTVRTGVLYGTVTAVHQRLTEAKCRLQNAQVRAGLYNTPRGNKQSNRLMFAIDDFAIRVFFCGK